MSKSIFRLMLALTIVASMFIGTNQAYALPGTTWATGIKLQNLDAGAEAILSIGLFDSSGASVATINQTKDGDPLKAAANKSVEVYLPNYDLSSGTYSAVVSSNVEIGAVVTATNYAYGIADSYNAMDPATDISVPYVYHNHNKWSTEIFIQNTSITETANVTVTLSETATAVSAQDGVAVQTVDLAIPPNGSVSVDTSKPEYGTGGTYNLGWFIGAATIKSTSVPVAVAFSQVRLVGAGDVKGNVMLSGRGLTSTDGGTFLSLPQLYREFSGVSGTWRSGIKIANLDSNPVEVVVTFESDPSPNITYVKVTKTVTIDGNASEELYLGNYGPNATDPKFYLDDPAASFPSKWRGFATVEVTSGTGPVVASVQHTNYTGAFGYGVAIGYAGFSQGSPEVSLPTLYHWPSGAGVWVTGIKIQNFVDAVKYVNVTFTPDPDSKVQTVYTATNVELPPNGANELYITSPIMDGGVSIASGWKGSATVVSTDGSDVAVTVTYTNYGRHVANMYTGVPIP